ncbi:MAG: exosortase system-associated protein, TIGR04073 family [Lentisphaeria bacterium]|nr:exosortase system-associated protein, TIGR04073 family [Lentisphaeria bacterium]
MWKKMLLVAMLFVAVGSVELSAQETATPTIVDQIVRKLGRGISNVAFGGLEFPLHWYQVNFEEGGLAASTYGILRGVVGVIVREVVGVVEIVTFPVPLPGCSDVPDSPAWGYGPILQPEWIVTPAQNKYNFIYPNQDTLP